jgi:hypothetical protein
VLFGRSGTRSFPEWMEERFAQGLCSLVNLTFKLLFSLHLWRLETLWLEVAFLGRFPWAFVVFFAKLVKDLLLFFSEQLPLPLYLFSGLPFHRLLFFFFAVEAWVVLYSILLLEGVLSYWGRVEDMTRVLATSVHNLFCVETSN